MTTQPINIVDVIMKYLDNYYTEIAIWPNYIVNKKEMRNILESHLSTQSNVVECPICKKRQKELDVSWNNRVNEAKQEIRKRKYKHK